MTKASSHNGYLDFLKFVFALGVMGVHTYLMGYDFRLVYCGHLGVDFFFMVSGYFTARAAMKARTKKNPNAPAQYFRHRISGFYPFFFAACLYSFLILQMLQRGTWATIKQDLYNSIFDFLPFQVEGFPSICVTSVQWYVGTLFVVAPLLYLVLFYMGNSFSIVVAPILGTFLFGLIQMKRGELSSVGIFIGDVFFAGFLRGIADICFGSVLYALSQEWGKAKLTRRGYIVMRIVRLILLAISVRLLFMSNSGYGDFVFVATIFWYLLLLFSFPVNAAFFKKPIFTELGKVSSTLFMVHVKTGQLISYLWPTGKIIPRLIVYYLTSIIVAWGLYHLVELFRSRQILRRFFIQTPTC